MITVSTGTGSGALDDRAVFACLRGAERTGEALKAMKGGAQAFGKSLERAERCFARMGESAEGLLAALMHTYSAASGLEGGLRNLYRWSRSWHRDLADGLDRLSTLALYLKNSLAALAAPVMNALAPAVEYVTDRFAGMFNWVNQVFSRLSGSDTYVAARRTAEAWDAVRGRITASASAVRRCITGFDQLNVLSAGYARDGGDSAGAAVSGMFETRRIEGGLAAFADRLKAAVGAADWPALGQLLGAKINEAVANVDWAALGQKVGFYIHAVFVTAGNLLETVRFGDIGVAIADFLNSALAGIDFSAVGSTLALCFTSAVETFSGFVSRFDWGQFAEQAAEAVNGFVGKLGQRLDAIDWAKLGDRLTGGLNAFIRGTDWAGLGKTLAGRFNDLLGLLGAAAKRFDWAGAGRALSNGLNSLVKNIDWKGVGRWFDSTVKGVLDLSIAFLKGFDAKGLAGSIREALDAVDWDGIAGKLWELLGTALSKLGELGGLGGTLVELFTGNGLDGLNLGALGKGLNGGRLEVEAGVNFQPNVAGGSAYRNNGLLGYLKQLFAPGVTTENRVQLIRQGWDSVSEWVSGLMGNTPVAQKVGLLKNLWDTVSGWVDGLRGNTAVNQNVGLSKVWDTVSGWVNGLRGNTTINQSVGLSKPWKSVSDWVDGFKGDTIINQVVNLWKAWDTVSRWVNDNKGTTAVDQNVGLSKVWNTVSAWVSNLMGNTGVEQFVGLTNSEWGSGWTSVVAWVKERLGNGDVDQLVGLMGKGWSYVYEWVNERLGGNATAGVDLTNSGTNWAKGIVWFLTQGKDIILGVSLAVKSVTGAVASIVNAILGKAEGGIVTAMGRSLAFASGGVISGGMARFLEGVPHYARGTTRAHGTLFVAGEAGPEIMGHINGRTEILNKSQLAQTMYGAVTSGMAAALRGLTFRMPAMATGGVMPYGVSAQIARTGLELQSTLDANNEDLIQTIISVIGAQTTAIVTALQAVERSAGGSGGALGVQSVINEINRRTQMFSASPLKGV